MRLALVALFALGVSTSADAQARFVNACTASAAVEGDEVPFDRNQVCGCAASQAVAAGVDPADLDRLIDYVQDDNIDVDGLPGPIRAAGVSVTESLLACALADTEGTGGAALPVEMARAYGESSDPDVTTVLSNAPVPRLPSGLRTGNGGGPVRTSAPSPGGAIRIIG